MSRPSFSRQFDNLVRLKYQLYNGLFLSLPFSSLAETGIKLPLLAERCARELQNGSSPTAIIDGFFRDVLNDPDQDTRMQVLFLFAQLIERQVVLFDALEEAAFPYTRPREGVGSLSYLLKRCESGAMRRKLKDALETYRTRTVLTAHPTQFYPEAVLGIIKELSHALDANDSITVETLLLQLGKTSFRNAQSPTPLSEAVNLVRRSKDVFYQAILDIESDLDVERSAPLIELGFWPGGDRDGNPYVTVETTLQTTRELRMCALDHYRDEIARLRKRLTFPGIASRLDRILGDLEAYDTPEQLISHINELIELVETQHQGLFVEQVQRFKLAVRLFGFHFATLDLRQDSSVHEQTVDTLLKAFGHAGYLRKSEAKRLELLEKWSEPTPSFNELLELVGSDISQDVLNSLAVVDEIQASNGERGLHRYIISNTRGAHHVMEILWLARCVGYKTVPLDIVPLFETIDDLRQAETTMSSLYASPLYLAHLKQRGDRQTIMVGFSDGTKDGGYLSCNWEIFKAKQRLEELSQQHGIDVIFFDGRGGPPARGGGNTHAFYRAVGAQMPQHQVQLTIQGQTISSHYGSYEAARHNLEQLFTAGLEPNLFRHEDTALTEKEQQLLDSLSERSLEAYLDLRGDPSFIPFLEHQTPLKSFGTLNVASRPSQRKQAKAVTLNNLRAIPFVGSWSQIGLNVPGYYGLGTALKWADDQARLDELRAMYRETLFFRTLINNAMQALSKSTPSLTLYLANDPTFGPFVTRLHKELDRTREYLLRVSGQQVLLEDDPVNRLSIGIREELILPMQVIQRYAMDKIHAGSDDPRYQKLLLKTLPPITNASRNSA